METPKSTESTVAVISKATPKKQRVNHVDFSDVVFKAFDLHHVKAVKEEGKRGEPDYKPGRKGGWQSSEHGYILSYDALFIQGEKMLRAGEIEIVKIPDGKPHAGEDAYGFHTVAAFRKMADNIGAFQEQKRVKKYEEQTPQDAVRNLHGRIAAFGRKLNGSNKPNGEREEGLIEKGAKYSWGFDFQPIIDALRAISDKADTMQMNLATTTREEAQAEHKKLTDLEKRLDSDLVIVGVDRLIRSFDSVKENMSNSVYNDLRSKALAITSRYSEGKLTVEAALFQTRDLRRLANPMVEKAKAMAAPPRRDSQKPGTAKFGDVARQNAGRRSR